MMQKILILSVVIVFMVGYISKVQAHRPAELDDLKSELKRLKTQVNKQKQELEILKTKAITACRICFQETEGSSQCQENRSSCSGWSTLPEWTLPFRDDTDSREGGCKYQWRLECRSDVNALCGNNTTYNND